MIFLLGLLQVALVSLNAFQVAHRKWVGAGIVGFLISYVWSFNVRVIAFGSMAEQLLYALGAACGTLLGMGIGLILYKRIK